MFKFRGQRVDNKEWIEGGLVYDNTDNTYFVYSSFEYGEEVIPETLSMSTGQLDKNKEMIFGSFEVDGKMSKGGDVVSGIDGFGKRKEVGVRFLDGAFYPLCEGEFYWSDIEIIGKQSEAK
jgi:hypothetical protein